MMDGGAKQKAWLVWVPAGLVVLCFYLFLLGPQLTAYVRDSRSLAAEGGRLERAKVLLAAGDEEREQLSTAAQEVRLMAGRFNGRITDGSLAVMLGMKAAADGVEITGIKPGPPQRGPHLIRIPLTITLRGDYLGLLTFCGEIEQDRLGDLTDIDGLRLSLPPEAAGLPYSPSPETASLLPGMVKAELKLSVYSDQTAGEPLGQEPVREWPAGKSNPFDPGGSWPAPAGGNGTGLRPIEQAPVTR